MKIEVKKVCVNCKHRFEKAVEPYNVVCNFCKKNLKSVYNVTGERFYKECSECVDDCAFFKPTFKAKMRAFIESLIEVKYKKEIQIKKNRRREDFTFANINLLGKCNADCYFCLGKDISKELAGKNQLNEHFSYWKNFERFLAVCKQEGIKKLYLTGQTADGLQYKYLPEIIDYLQGKGFSVGVRTNGLLAVSKMFCIQKMKDEIAYSIHSLKPEINQKIMGVARIPDWDYIIPASGDNVRISIVLCRYNINEFDDLIRYISKFDNVRYIQVRRISTDTRYELLKEDITLYEDFYKKFAKEHKADRIEDFYLAQRYMLYGKEINFWRTVETSINSLNYFTDGTCSDEYFIVEGYLKKMNKKLFF